MCVCSTRVYQHMCAWVYVGRCAFQHMHTYTRTHTQSAGHIFMRMHTRTRKRMKNIQTRPYQENRHASAREPCVAEPCEPTITSNHPWPFVEARSLHSCTCIPNLWLWHALRHPLAALATCQGTNWCSMSQMTQGLSVSFHTLWVLLASCEENLLGS